MATVTKQAQEISFTLADRLKQRFSAYTFVEGQATDGNPLITIGSGSAGAVNALVKVKAIDFGLVLDSLGLTPAYSPYTNHVIQLVTEANYAATSDNVADVLTPQQVMDLLCEIVQHGAQVEWWQSATGVAPTETTLLTGSNRKGIFRDLYYPYNMV